MRTEAEILMTQMKYISEEASCGLKWDAELKFHLFERSDAKIGVSIISISGGKNISISIFTDIVWIFE